MATSQKTTVHFRSQKINMNTITDLTQISPVLQALFCVSVLSVVLSRVDFRDRLSQETEPSVQPHAMRLQRQLPPSRVAYLIWGPLIHLRRLHVAVLRMSYK